MEKRILGNGLEVSAVGLGCMGMTHYFLNPLNTNNYLSPLIQKGAKNTINISNQRFLENRIPLPIDEMEVKLVSDSLSALDKKLMLEFTVLTSLKRQKNFLLRNLFI